MTNQQNQCQFLRQAEVTLKEKHTWSEEHKRENDFKKLAEYALQLGIDLQDLGIEHSLTADQAELFYNINDAVTEVALWDNAYNMFNTDL